MVLGYRVPQNIDIEDKIIGPFTLKQFLILVVGGVLSYLSYAMLNPYGLIIVMMVMLPIIALSVALVFVKINERPFSFFLVAMLSFLLRPQQLIWARSPEESDIRLITGEKKALEKAKKEVKKVAAGQAIASSLEELAMIVDARGWVETETAGKGLAGRIISSREEKQKLSITLPQEKELEDVFAAFERALKVEEEKEEEELEEIGAGLAEVLAKRGAEIRRKIG